MEVLVEEAITFMIMERESCDYETATGRALGRHDQPLNTVYFDKWYELLPKKRALSIEDIEARRAYDVKVMTFI